MMAMISSVGVQIRMADGGYIIQWFEPNKKPDQAPSYLEQERQQDGPLSGCMHHGFMPPRLKCAVRVKLEDALKLAGEVLERLQAAGVDEELEGPEDLQAG